MFLKCDFDPDFFPVTQAMLARNGILFELGANID